MRRLLTAAVLAMIAIAAVTAFGMRASCGGPCPPTLPVADRFWFAHRDLGPQGSITVRLTGMSGTITYPPPDHDEIVSGLVPWAKAGIIIKDGTRAGSPYAALMMTGDHGVRLQHGYRHDIAGSSGRDVPHWLRLSRDGTTITAAESFDGQAWHTVGTVAVPGLPSTAQAGLFATSPGDLTVTGGTEQTRFTQAVGTFEAVSLTGAPEQPWRSDAVGELNHTDWERFHNPAGARFAADGTITVSGSGDIGPISEDRRPVATAPLSGLVIVLIALLACGYPSVRAAFVTGALAGAIATGGAIAIGRAILALRDVPPAPLPLWTGVWLTLGVTLTLGLCTVLGHGLHLLLPGRLPGAGRSLRDRWPGIAAALLLIAIPYLLATVPLLPVEAARWLLRVTPAVGFAVLQTVPSYPQVEVFEAPWKGYYPLPAWAGLLVLFAWSAAILALPRWLQGARSPSDNDGNSTTSGVSPNAVSR